MKMNPHAFYRAFVEANYDDFLNEPDNVRKGINAAVSAFHMADQYYFYYQKNDPIKISSYKDRDNFLKYLASKSKYFNDIQSIANAYKHLYLNSSKSHVSIASTGCIESIGFRQHNITIDGCERDNALNYIVIYTTKTSKKIKLLIALKAVVDMWDKIINP